jgi:hypothetical protein
MTIQFSERLLLRGQEMTMRSFPLRAYLDIVKPLVNCVSTHTACWRGYVGEWELCDDQLYLQDLKANVMVYGVTRPARLTDFFPEAKGKVFAHWFSGELRIPNGRQIYSNASRYNPQFEEEIVLTVKAGVLLEEQRIRNVEGNSPHA